MNFSIQLIFQEKKKKKKAWSKIMVNFTFAV